MCCSLYGFVHISPAVGARRTGSFVIIQMLHFSCYERWVGWFRVVFCPSQLIM